MENKDPLNNVENLVPIIPLNDENIRKLSERAASYFWDGLGVYCASQNPEIPSDPNLCDIVEFRVSEMLQHFRKELNDMLLHKIKNDPEFQKQVKQQIQDLLDSNDSQDFNNFPENLN